MSVLTEYESRIAAAHAEGDIDALLSLDREIRRVAWSAPVRRLAADLAGRAAQAAADLAGYPVLRWPEFSGSEDGRTPPASVPARAPARVPGRAAVALQRSAAQKAADRKYDATRQPPIAVRLSGAGYRWIDARREPGETRARALCRLAGVPV